MKKTNKSQAAVSLAKLRWNGKTEAQRAEQGRKMAKGRTKESYEIAAAKSKETRRKKKELKWRPKVFKQWKESAPKRSRKIPEKNHKLMGRKVLLFVQRPERGWESIGSTAIDRLGKLIIIPDVMQSEQVELAEKWIASCTLTGQRIKDGFGFKMIVQPKE